MGSSGVVDREAITAAFDALDAAVDKVAGLDCDALTTREWLVLLERSERVRRRLPALEQPPVNNLGRPPRGFPTHQSSRRPRTAARPHRRTLAAGVGGDGCRTAGRQAGFWAGGGH